MIRPTKYLKLQQCTLRVAALLLAESKRLLAIPLHELDGLVRARLGDTASANLQHAVNLLFLVGALDYDDTADAVVYVDSARRAKE